MSYALLKDVTPQSQQWTIRARVIRFSEYLSTDQPPKVLRLDFVALDEEGTAMDGQIPTACLLKFTPHFKEESLYSITSFHVTNARAIYRPVNHPYLIRFTSYTKLKEIRPVPDGFPKYTHSAIQFHQLQSRIGIHDYCSDIVGVLTGVTHTRMQSTSKGEKPLRNVHVSDGSQEIAIALWGRQAEAFDAESYMEMAARGPVIFLFVGMTCGQYNGKISLHGSSFCRWYADPDIPEAVALRDRYIGQLPLAKWLDTGSGAVTPTRITVTELAAFRDPHPIYTNKYIVHIKIKEIKTDQPWCFYACELCNKGMKESSDGNKCTKPNCPGTIGRNRYRVPIIVVDPMPSPHNNEPCFVEMVLFGKLAEELIGMPVDALIACAGEPNGPLPKRMTALYGRQFEVRISVSPISMSLTTIIYQIDRITRMMNVVLPDPKTPHLTQLPEQQKSPQTSSLAISDASTLQNTMQENVGPTSPNDDPTKNNTQDPGPVVTNLLATPPLQNMEPAKEPPVPKDGSLKRSIAAMDDSDPTNAQRTDIPHNSRQVKRRLDLSGPSDEN